MPENQPDETVDDGFNGQLTNPEFLGWLAVYELEYQFKLESKNND